MPVVDLDNYQPQDAIYDEALLLRNARLGELARGLWTRSQRYQFRKNRLAERYQRFLQDPATNIASGDYSELPLAVVGFCEAQDICCQSGQWASVTCKLVAACGCKMLRHPSHVGHIFQGNASVAIDLQVAEILGD